MASSSSSFRVEDDGKTLAEKGKASCNMDGCDPGQTEKAEASRGNSIPLANLTCHSSNDNEGWNSPQCCSTCGLEQQDLHRMKKDGALLLYCSSCVLFHHKGMYCCQCFQVYPGDSALSLICSKCQRFCHTDCAQKQGLSTNSFSFACQYCYHEIPVNQTGNPILTVNQTGNPTLKRSRSDIPLQERSSLSDQEALAAAQIVACFAAKEAKEAKGRARACAAIAAKAAKLAKAALDVAYRAGLEEVRWRLEVPKQTLVAAPINQTVKTMQTGAYFGNARTQQTYSMPGLDDKTRHKTFMASHHRVVGKNFGNANCDSDGSKAAATNLSYHQRRVLPPVVSPDVTGPPFMHPQCVQKLPQRQQNDCQPLCSLMESAKHGSVSSLPKEQRFVNGSEGLVVAACPESILESSTPLGTPKPDSVAHPDTLELAGNLIHGTEIVEIFSDEEEVDDFVYVGDLLAESLEKEGNVSGSLEYPTGSPTVFDPSEGKSVVERSVEASSGCICMNGAASGVQSHQLIAVSDVATHTCQLSGATLAVSSQSGTPFACTQHKSSESAASLVSLQ